MFFRIISCPPFPKNPRPPGKSPFPWSSLQHLRSSSPPASPRKRSLASVYGEEEIIRFDANVGTSVPETTLQSNAEPRDATDGSVLRHRAVKSADFIVEPATDVGFQKDLRAPGCSSPLSLLGAGLPAPLPQLTSSPKFWFVTADCSNGGRI